MRHRAPLVMRALRACFISASTFRRMVAACSGCVPTAAGSRQVATPFQGHRRLRPHSALPLHLLWPLNTLNVGKFVSGSWVWTQANTNGNPITTDFWSCYDLNFDGTAVIAGAYSGSSWLGRLSSETWSWTAAQSPPQDSSLYAGGCAISADGTRATATTTSLWTGMYSGVGHG